MSRKRPRDETQQKWRISALVRPVVELCPPPTTRKGRLRLAIYTFYMSRYRPIKLDDTIAPDRQMMAVTIGNAGGRLEIGTPKALFDSRMRADSNINFDVAKDGRFLLPTQDESTTIPLTLVTNWQAGLKK